MSLPVSVIVLDFFLADNNKGICTFCFCNCRCCGKCQVGRKKDYISGITENVPYCWDLTVLVQIQTTALHVLLTFTLLADFANEPNRAFPPQAAI